MPTENVIRVEQSIKFNGPDFKDRAIELIKEKAVAHEIYGCAVFYLPGIDVAEWCQELEDFWRGKQ